MKKLLFLILILMFIPTVNAQDYTISNYDIYVTVHEDNTYDIAEIITANFNIDKHGIYRTIPLKNEIYRTDGSKDTTYAKIKNLSVDNSYSTSKSNNIYTIKIGSPTTYVKGKQTYNINYTYELYRSEKNRNYDEFYFNLIGNDWDTSISKVNFNIEMPKEFDKNKVGFSRGLLGTINSDNITYEVDNNIIKGSCTNLKANEALTIRLELEEGYFKNKINLEDIAIIVSIACLIISFIIWYLYGKDQKAIETVEFYPPLNLNSLELAFMYKGKVRNKDVTSLLVYLANKGYIKITEYKNTSLLSSNSFRITKIKDYDGNNELERIFMDGLFKYGATSVTSEDLYDNFYVTTDRLKKQVTNKKNQQLIFENNSRKANIFLIFLTIFMTFVLPLLIDNNLSLGVILVILVLFYTPFYKLIFQTKNIFITLFIVIHSSFFFFGIGGTILSQYSYLTTSFLVALICLALMLIIYYYMPKRNKYGLEVLGKIKGFKTFLETVEKEQLEKLVLENPTYFYDILPYTYVLDISDKWINKFEQINLQAPEWYYGPSFEYYHFTHFINNTVNDSNITARAPSTSSSGFSGGSSSGGSFSGGGFSGGGSGGGGGGSW